jgi:hypothetical protein
MSASCARSCFDAHLLTQDIDRHTLIAMRRVAVFIPEQLLAGLKVLKAEYGTPEAESIRRAIAAYLAEKGMKPAQRGASRPKKRK